MKKVSLILSAFLSLALLTACGAQDEVDSGLSAAAGQANLIGSALNFRCGNGVVVVQVKNVGNAVAASSFVRIDQSNAPSQAFGVRRLNPGESQNLGLTVKYKNGALDATIRIDSTNNVQESNEGDNQIRLVCR